MKPLFKKIFDKSGDKNLPDLSLLPPPPIWSRLLIWTLGFGTLSLILWSIFSKVEETFLFSGEITTLTPQVKISAADSGLVTKILVKPSDSIKVGDHLMSYTDNETSLRLKSLVTQIELAKNKLSKELNMYKYRILQSQRQIELSTEILSRLESLLVYGAIQESQVLEQRSKLVQAKLSLSSLLEEKERSNYQSQQSLEELEQRHRELLAKRELSIITSPVTGYVQEMQYQTVGERIQSGEIVATIVPKDDLIARINIPSRLSAPLKINDGADVDIDAFPAADYGSVAAHIVSISPMTMNNRRESMQQEKQYSANLKLERASNPEKLFLSDLRPGMAVTARIKLRDKPAISTVFSFLDKMFEPLTEQR